MATKVMVGIPFTSYPITSIDLDYVAVKVPQFSFSRLLGADPVLGVEMASTGEVACFGKDKYEAYLKALVATGFKLPKKNVLISIGSFEQKQDMLAPIRKLTGMGYSLFGTPGSQDFLKGHGLDVTYLEYLEKDDEQAREFSLAWWIKEKKVDLFISKQNSTTVVL